MEEEKPKEFVRIFSVSQFEILIATFLLVALFVYVLFATLSGDGYMQQYFDILRSNSDAIKQYDLLSAQINSNSLAGNTAVFTFWSTIGLLAYYLVYFLVLSEKNTAKFMKQLFQRDTDKEQILEYTFAQMAIRVGSVILLVTAINFFIHKILPYIIVALNFSAQSTITELFVYTGAVFVLLTIFGHVITILIRGTLLRQRLFLE